MNHFGRNLQWAAFIFLCCIAVAHPAGAGTLNLNGRWTYSQSDAEDSDSFRQIYQASYIGNADLTELINLRGGLRYSLDIPDSNPAKHFLSPSLTLSNTNDIYAFSLNGNYNISRQSDEPDRDNWNWNSSLASTWGNKVWPFLKVNYGQSGTKTSDNRIDAFRSSSNGSIDWGYYDWLQLTYSISWSDFEDRVSGAASTTLGNFARALMGGTFFDSRLYVSFEQTFQDTFSDITAPVQDGVALLPVTVSQASYEETDDPLSGFLTNDAFFLLSDADQPPETLVIDPLNEPMNLGLRVDFNETEVIYLSTKEDISEYADSFTWDLYSSENGFDWEPAEADLAFIYNEFEQRFEFEVGPMSVRYVKLVAAEIILLPVEAVEIVSAEVFRKVEGEEGFVTEESNTNHYRTLFNFGYNALDSLRFYYNFTFDRSEQDETAATRDQMTNSGGVFWTPHQYFTARININDFRIEETERPDDISRNYSLSLASEPLDTLTFNFTFRRAEKYTDDDLTLATHNYSIYSTAQLYEDLLATLLLGYTTREEGEGSDSVIAELRVAARLKPTLTIEMRPALYTKNLDTGDEVFGSDIVMYWRISDLMYLNGTFRITKFEEDLHKSLELTYSVSPTNRSRFSFGYNYFGTDLQNLHSLRGTWYWLITRAFNFVLSGNYAINDSPDKDDIWNFTAQLRYQYNNEN